MHKDTPLILYCGLDSNYFNHQEISFWAENIFNHYEIPPHWVTQLSLCQKKEMAEKILRCQIIEDHLSFDKRYSSMLLGFLRKALEQGKLTKKEFQQQFIDAIDSYEIASIDPERLKNHDFFVERSHLPLAEEIFLSYCDDICNQGLKILEEELSRP